METIPKKECVNIGFIRKLHGVQGEVTLEFEYDFESSVENATRFFIEMEGLLVPFFLNENGFRFKSAKTAVLNLKWINSEKKAKKLIEKKVYLFKNEIDTIEQEIENNPLVDFVLLDENEHEIGKIEKVDDFSGNIVLTVQYKNEKILIPFHDELVVFINHEEKNISLKIPEGII